MGRDVEGFDNFRKSLHLGLCYDSRVSCVCLSGFVSWMGVFEFTHSSNGRRLHAFLSRMEDSQAYSLHGRNKPRLTHSSNRRLANSLISSMEDYGKRCNTESVLECLLKDGVISKENPCGLFVDQRVLEENINEIKQAFPEPFFHHHYAVKANPIKSVLKVVKSNGFGVECASFGEVVMVTTISHRFTTRCKPACLPVM